MTSKAIPAQTETRRPNVLWIFGDQHRAQATGYAGDPNVCTPNLDRLATEGVNCRGAVSGFPLCSPARGALLTGMYPHRCVPGHEYPLPPGQRTIAHVLGDAGYRTGYFGKWHLGGWHERNGRGAFHITDPAQRGGFHEWLGYENNNSQYDCWVHGGAGKDAVHYRLPGYESDALTDHFIDYLKRQSADQPFFGVLSLQPPHNPYVAPESWMQRHTPGRVTLRPNVPNIPSVLDRARRELAGYYAMIENLDWNVGRIRTTLADLGLAHDTLIVFFSDHGDQHGSQGQFLKTAPWEESIRVPLIIGGGVPLYGINRGGNDAPIGMPDLAPTTLGLCGVTVPEGMQGRDFSGVRVPGRALPADADSALLQCVVPTGHPDSVDRPWRGVVTREGWKYVVLENQPWLMFNLADDPYEQSNHAHNARFAAERKRLQALLAGWLEKTGDAFPLPAI